MAKRKKAYEIAEETVDGKAITRIFLPAERKSHDNLEGLIAEIKKRVPGIAEHLKGYSNATWGMHWSGGPEDVTYIETPEYHIVGSKWEEHHYSEDGGGIQWKEWAELHYQKKGTGEIKTKKGGEVITRHQYNPNLDEQGLWPYNYISVELAGKNSVSIAWTDRDGNKEQSYAIRLS